MRVGFVTCVELGLACIREIHAIGGHLDLMVTLRDDIGRKKSGRVYLDEIADRHGTPLHKVRHINDADSIQVIRKADLDWLFIVGWSQIASREVIDLPKIASLGMHPTMLPFGRGRAAIPWTILKGLTRSGVTLFQLEAGVDSGPIVAQAQFDVADRDTAASVYDKVVDAHMELIRTIWHRLLSNDVTFVPQDESKATYWPGRKPEDGRFTDDWTVEAIDRLVRAVGRPYPGAFIDLKPGERVRVWAGQPQSETPSGRDVLRIVARDGVYVATEYERETLG